MSRQPAGAVIKHGVLKTGQPRRTGRLFRKYVLLFVVVVAVALLLSGILQIWIAYGEQRNSLLRFQYEQAEAAADKISQFVREIEGQLGWTTQLPRTDETLEQQRFDIQRLLRQVPAITEVKTLDQHGHETLRVSRMAVDTVGSGADHSDDAMFLEAMKSKISFGPVRFRQGSEPYMAIGVSGNRRLAGVSIADVNLKFIWDVVSRIQVGKTGTAFVVDGRDRLIAHPDISLVLKNTDLSQMEQVRSARRAPEGAEPVQIAKSMNGQQVVTAYAPVFPLAWNVFVELPLDEAFAPIRAAVIRSAILLIAGLILATLAGLLLARRMTGPIRVLQQGAVRIGQGELDKRIRIQTGDELEDLAGQFNMMSEQLQQLYGNLERVSQLKRYFSPHLAELIVSSEASILGESHRRDITVLFCDLRGFTAFSLSATPETVMNVLGDYYRKLGIELRRHEATIGHFAGDGLMAFLNDPFPCNNHQVRMVHMAMAMQKVVGDLLVEWRADGIELGFGVGIASGDATLGHIGSDDQFHYTAIGPVVNLASRLCDEAADADILIDATVRAACGDLVEAEPVGKRRLKGFSSPVPVFSLSVSGRGNTLPIAFTR